LFVNPRSGGGKAACAGVAERVRNGMEAIISTSGQTWRRWPVERGSRADALGAADGDGSLAVVAAAAAPVFHLCAFRPGRTTTSHSTWAWTGTV
jgi:hypothetical protein